MKVQQIKAEIERWKKELRLSTSCEAKYRREMLDDISEFIDSLQEEPVSEDLEDAAERYYKDYEAEITEERKDYNGIDTEACAFIKPAFIAGANWRKEQMLKDAVDADAEFDYYDKQDRLNVSILATDVLAENYGLRDGDKPKIIIVKEVVL